MKITLAKSAGFCFGVKRALKMARQLAVKNTPVVMLGDIVHNDDVVRDIKKLGIKKTGRLCADGERTLLIRAHGTSLDTFVRAKKLGYTVADATCPMVREIHKIASEGEKQGYTIIVIGDKKHDEVQGILGQLNRRALVIDSLKSIPAAAAKIKKARIVVQSTQDIEKVLPIVTELKKRICKVDFVNTICNPTKTKQKEIRALPLKNDVMIIIGSKKSANTKRLYQISRNLNPKSYWIGSRKEINPDWFRNAESVGITAGASTPDYVTREVVEYISKL